MEHTYKFAFGGVAILVSSVIAAYYLLKNEPIGQTLPSEFRKVLSAETPEHRVRRRQLGIAAVLIALICIASYMDT